MTAGSSELEKVGSIFLQVNLLHQRVQVVVQRSNKLQPGTWEELAVRGTRGKLDLIGTSSVTVHLLWSSECSCQQITGTLVFFFSSKDIMYHRSVAHSEKLFS